MVIIALLPLAAVALIIIFVFFMKQIKIENYKEDMYKKYGAVIKVNISSSMYTPFGDRVNNHYYFKFNVSFTDSYGKKRKYTVSTNNKNAKKYLDCGEMEVFCLLSIFEDYGSIEKFVTQTSDTQKELIKNLRLCSVPLMVLKDDRDFRKLGNTHRFKVICSFLFIMLIIFILTYRL